MKAIGFSQSGGPQVLHVFDRPEQHAGPGEVRIRVLAATVNPADTMARTGMSQQAMTALERPYVVGMEAAGTIDEVGEGVSLRVGEDVTAIVLPFGPRGGAYAEHVIVRASHVFPTPKGMDSLAAATLPMNGLTAVMALDTLALSKGAIIAVTGAAGALGGYVVQLARAAGLQVIADASEADEALVRGLGAHHVVRRGVDVAGRIRDLQPAGVAGLVDASVQNIEVTPAIADGGTMVIVRAWSGDPGRGIRKEHVSVSQGAGRADLLAKLRQSIEKGVLTPRVARSYPAEEAAAAHRAMEAGGVRGRLVLTF